jgi:hypothetical protein
MRISAALFAVVLLADATAQSSTPPVAPGAATPRTKQAPPAKGAQPRPAKAVLPDPEILDGSKYEPEKRPLYGMLSEIEMGEEEGDQQADRISPNSGPQGAASAEAQKSGGAQQQQQQQAQQQGGSSQPVAQGGPQGQAVGAQAQNLQVPQGAQNPPGGAQDSARNMQIGDATLQIQTVPQTPDTVGTEPSQAQQYEKKVPAGQQSNNRNQGVEKGKVIPKGL